MAARLAPARSPRRPPIARTSCSEEPPSHLARAGYAGLMTTLRGRCLCGDVRFEIRGDLGVFTLCHCGACRKAQGSAFVAAAPVRLEHFVLLGGDGSLTAYESSQGKERVFCSRCGSPIFSRRASKIDV